MQFSRRWWVDDYAITHGVTVTDLAIRNVVYTPAGQDPSIDQLRREPEHAPAQGVDQEELNQVVEREPEESVDVAADHPAHGVSFLD